MRTWSPRATLRLFVVTALIAAGVALDPPARAQGSPSPLSAGTPVERRLVGGETHLFSFTARPDDRLLLTADQRGIDLALELRRGDGSVVLAVDGPTDSEGRESLLLPPDLAGPLELRVLAPNPGAAPGTYLLRLEALPDSAPAERRRLEAERLLTEAGASNREGAAGAPDVLRHSAALYEEAQARFRELGDGAQEARCALSAGAVHAALGEAKPAAERAEAALALFQERGDEGGAAAAWTGLGLARSALGDAAGAVAAQTEAIAVERRLGHALGEAKARNNLGFALHTQGELRPAREQYALALAGFQAAGEHGWWEATVLQNLAAAETSLGEIEEALRSHLRVLERQRALGDRRGEAQTLNNLGVLRYDRGEAGAARAAYAEALAIVRGLGDRRWEAALLHNLGHADAALGDFPGALSRWEAALRLRREIGDRAGEAGSEAALGNALFQLGETGRAEAAARHAAATASAAGDRRNEMEAQRLLAKVRLAAGEAEAALPALARGRELAEALGDRGAEALILRDLGVAQLGLGQPAQAVERLTQALDRARSARSPARLVAVLTALARAERAAGRDDEARARIEEALGLVEGLRLREPDPELRALLLASQHAAFEQEIDLLMGLDRKAPGQGFARTAFEAAERARARSLLDLLQEASAEVREGVDPSLRERERTLLLRLRAKEARRTGPPDPALAPSALESEIRAILEELTGVQAAIRRGNPLYAALTQGAVATSREAEELLDGETVLLAYALGEERSYLWLVERGAVSGFELPPRAAIETAARALYARLSVVAEGAGDFDALRGDAARLGELVLRPLRGRLGEKRLVVLADGGLQFIPFGVLPDPDSAPDPLLLRHEVVYAASASSVALQRRAPHRQPAALGVAVLADPVFDARDPRLAGGPAVRPGAGATESDTRSESAPSPLPRLPWTGREAEAIAKVAAASPQRPFLQALGLEATRQWATTGLSTFGILHFATHGRIDTRTPALSGLELSRVDAEGRKIEGFLGLGDIYNLRLAAGLVVLSGCETALGQEVRGEGLVGLTQGFLYAGARQVVASLWRVEDRATAELMSAFYRGLLVEGRSPAAALRQAQLAVRSDRRWRSPYYWSGFVVQGDWAAPPRP